MALWSMARGRLYRRRAVAAASAFALILQSLLAADVMAAIAIGEEGAYRTITICTGDGYRQITLDANNNPVAPPADDGANECPACVLASTGSLALPVDPGLRCRSIPPSKLSLFDVQTKAVGWAPYARHGRGPPPSIPL